MMINLFVQTHTARASSKISNAAGDLSTFPYIASTIRHRHVSNVFQRLPILLAASLVGTIGCSRNDENPPEEPPIIIIPNNPGDDMSAPPDMTSMNTADMAGDLGLPMPDFGGGGTRFVCMPAKPWSASQEVPAFANRTTESNLEALAAEGGRISGVDFDGDGDTDLILRRINAPAGDDFSPDGRRTVWLLENRGDGTFEDATQTSGFVTRRDGQQDRGRPIEIAAFADIDNDGDLDAITTTLEPAADNLSPEGAEVVLNTGNGTFALSPLEKHDLRLPDGRPSIRSGVIFTDFDRDGFIDVFITHGSGSDGPEQDHLFRGDGQGGFIDVTDDLGLITRPWMSLADLNNARAHTNSWGGNACDLNNDGWPDLLSASYGRAPNHLWQSSINLQGRTFINRSIDSGYAFDEQTDWTDNESARCHCMLNPGDDDCAGVPDPVIRCQVQTDAFRWQHDFDRFPFRLGGNSGTTVCADINNDGNLDLLTSEIVHWDVGSSSDPSQILYNKGEPNVAFTRPGNDVTGLLKSHGDSTWDDGDITAAVFDFDNDGRLDIYIGSTDYSGTRGWLYHQQEDGTFEDVSIKLGIDHKSSHGLAVADFDNDGDLDLVAGHSRNRCSTGDHCYERAHARYFENLVGNQNHWIQLDLEGAEGTNRAAIGARVEVRAGDLLQVHEIDGGHGHYGIQHDMRAHFGLGDACKAEVTIYWPDSQRTSQTFTVDADSRYRVVQGEEPRKFSESQE